MTIIDWLIVGVALAGMVYPVLHTRGLMQSVADFLVAGRSAGRYVMSISSGVAGLGAITIVYYLEMNYIAGFAMSWWGMTSALVLLFITVSGWVIYRFRQTKCLTLPQFFEMRYSRRFRVFTGVIAFVSGLLNFGIFPAVGARFFIYFCELPQSFVVGGITLSTFALLMVGLLSISLFFVFTGGQIAVLIADFFQGVFVNLVFVVIILFLFLTVDWSHIQDSLVDSPGRLAGEEVATLVETEEFAELPLVAQDERLREIRERSENSSRINPFRTGHVEDFNFWYFLIGLVGVMYSTMSWQGTQAYNASASSAHEAKMGSVLSGWRGLPQTLFFLFVPIVAYTLMNHGDYAGVATAVGSTLKGVQPEVLESQLRVPLVLAQVLPVGLKGAFAAVMLAAFISTHDTYLHSWGTILVQDVILPLRRRPFHPKQHMKMLRLAIVLVAIFIFFFSLLFQQNQKIALFFAITGAIFAGGSGAVIIGGLYWRRGTTAAAWTAICVGAGIAVSGIVIYQIPLAWLEIEGGNIAFLQQTILLLKGINGQLYWGIGMGMSSLSYILVSLFGRQRKFDLDRLLRRGEYLDPDETRIVSAAPERGWKMLGMGREFTAFDKFIYVVNYVWTCGWTLVFIVGTVHNLTHVVADDTWMAFWRIYLLIHVSMAVVSILWFTAGGFRDLRAMMQRLRGMRRDHRDDGFVTAERSHG